MRQELFWGCIERCVAPSHWRVRVRQTAQTMNRTTIMHYPDDEESIFLDPASFPMQYHEIDIYRLFDNNHLSNGGSQIESRQRKMNGKTNLTSSNAYAVIGKSCVQEKEILTRNAMRKKDRPMWLFCSKWLSHFLIYVLPIDCHHTPIQYCMGLR